MKKVIKVIIVLAVLVMGIGVIRQCAAKPIYSNKLAYTYPEYEEIAYLDEDMNVLVFSADRINYELDYEAPVVGVYNKIKDEIFVVENATVGPVLKSEVGVLLQNGQEMFFCLDDKGNVEIAPILE